MQETKLTTRIEQFGGIFATSWANGQSGLLGSLDAAVRASNSRIGATAAYWPLAFSIDAAVPDLWG